MASRSIISSASATITRSACTGSVSPWAPSAGGRRAPAAARVLADRIEPGLISEHLAWSAVGGRHLNELLPLPGTEEALAVVCRAVAKTQEFLGRQILVENISSYLGYDHTTIPEPEFIREVVARTGCGLLLDINNVFVSAHNLGFDPRTYLAAIPHAAVQEIHLAGHSRMGNLLVDTHGTRVADAVWNLYAGAFAHLPRRPPSSNGTTTFPSRCSLRKQSGPIPSWSAALISLLELQQAFADAVFGKEESPCPAQCICRQELPETAFGIYRSSVLGNYRKASARCIRSSSALSASASSPMPPTPSPAGRLPATATSIVTAREFADFLAGFLARKASLICRMWPAWNGPSMP